MWIHSFPVMATVHLKTKIEIMDMSQSAAVLSFSLFVAAVQSNLKVVYSGA